MRKLVVDAWLFLVPMLTACSEAAPTVGAEPSGGTANGGVSGLGSGGASSNAGTSGGTSGAGLGGASTSPGGGGAATGGSSVAEGGTATTGGAATTAGTSGTAGSSSAGSGGSPDIPACETNQVARCSGNSPIACDFGGGPGDYLVTVDVGAAAAASTTYVEAESYRRMLPSIELAAGETKRFSFGVNVRQPEGQPIQDVPAGTPGLQLYLRGSAPQLSAVCVQPLTAKPKLWIAGDSTVCDQSGTDYAGWGQHLPQHFSAPVVVANYADSGESSTSVLASGKLWGAIKAGWKAGDWVLVQVGHNDKDVTAATFRSNITTFVTQAKTAGVHIVLCTPIARVGYTLEAEHQSSAGANIPQIIKDVAKAENVPLIDLTTSTWQWLQTVDWKQYFALGTDRTHTNPAGAEVVAGLVRAAIREQKLELATFLR